MQLTFDVPKEGTADVFGFGTNAVDFLISVPSFPPLGSKVALSTYVRAAGGEVATTCVGLRRLGFRTAYAGRFGDDDAGHFGIASLEEADVDTQHVEVITGAETQIAFIVIDEPSGERTVIWKRDEKLAYSAAESPVEGIKGSRLLHMTHHDTAACIELAKVARANGIPVSLDVDNVVPGIEDLLPLVDLLISSAEFPGRLTGEHDLQKALPLIQSNFGCAVTGTTLGDKGSLLYCGGASIVTDGFAVPGGCKDTTGAGDAFRVGFLAGVLDGDSVEDCARKANAVAALKCRAVGARTALPTVDELESFLNK